MTLRRRDLVEIQPVDGNGKLLGTKMCWARGAVLYVWKDDAFYRLDMMDIV